MLAATWDSEVIVWQNLHNVQEGITKWKFTKFEQLKVLKKEIVTRIGGIQR